MENDKSYAYVRQQDAPLLPPPISEAGLIGWFNQNILNLMNDFSSVKASLRSIVMAVVTLGLIYYSAQIIWALIDFMFIEAVWTDPDETKRDVCTTVIAGGIQHDGCMARVGHW